MRPQFAASLLFVLSNRPNKLCFPSAIPAVKETPIAQRKRTTYGLGGGDGRGLGVGACRGVGVGLGVAVGVTVAVAVGVGVILGVGVAVGVAVGVTVAVGVAVGVVEGDGVGVGVPPPPVPMSRNTWSGAVWPNKAQAILRIQMTQPVPKPLPGFCQAAPELDWTVRLCHNQKPA